MELGMELKSNHRKDEDPQRFRKQHKYCVPQNMIDSILAGGIDGANVLSTNHMLFPKTYIGAQASNKTS
jgi:hypothetical protein